MDEAKLQEIEARTNAATPGPWIGDGEFGFVFQRGASRAHCIARLDHEDVRDTSGADLAFLAAARTDVPDLVAEVRRLTAALDVVTAERDGLWTRLGAHEGALHDTIARLRDEKAELRTQVDVAGDAQQRIAAAWNQIAGHFLVSPNPANAERIARLACAAADVRDEATATRDEAVAELQRLRAEHAAALATARREGAEGMRWEASEAAEQWLREVAEVTEDSPADLADAIRALPLDGDGGAT